MGDLASALGAALVCGLLPICRAALSPDLPGAQTCVVARHACRRGWSPGVPPGLSVQFSDSASCSNQAQVAVKSA